jgi:hypothetical protein
MKHLRTTTFISSFFILLGSVGCAPSLSLYDQYALAQAISVKVDALNLMDQATDDYQAHQKEIAALNTEIEKIYEYDKWRTKDSLTIKQWDILKNPDGHLLGGFLSNWKKHGKESSVFIGDKKIEVSAAFDQIIKLELAKNKSK